MEENLVIVESPAKAKTIERFLGKDFQVKSCYGHIRDLSKKKLGIDLEKDYEPQYIVSDDKKKIVAELKKDSARAQVVWLASDEDREGEAIAWHLSEVLELKPEKTRRIVFHEITKEAIQTAIKAPRNINLNLVNAQQARRVLDRLVGFELSPVLWKKVKPSLSAGRVQSVAVRLLVERERDIIAFNPAPYYKVTASFCCTDKENQEATIEAEITERFNAREDVLAFMEVCKEAQFKITDVSTKPLKRTPAPPFTTSTLQQEASRKLGFSVAQTMSVAQKLYEAGKITYMRTDSVNLSSLALSGSKKTIIAEYGEKYAQTRNFKTKTKGAQEAHEAIRPTYLENKSTTGSVNERRLYELIWKRTIASQMSDALLEKTVITISLSNHDRKFIATGEVIKFDGFIKVYKESTDDDAEEKQVLLPEVKVGQLLEKYIIHANQKFTQRPARFTEASLVKKLEELGIGRPSTYAPTISTIQNRGYVSRESTPGINRQVEIITLDNGKISEKVKTETSGSEKAKLVPSDIGMVVNDFLVENFKDIINFNFTASVEKQFDEIADGHLEWRKMIDDFYGEFHEKVESTLSETTKTRGERALGEDPVSGDTVYAKIGPYGPMVQIGVSNGEVKPKFASLLKAQRIETITLEDALSLFKLPRTVGTFEEKEVVSAIGRYGAYIRHDNKFYSLGKDEDDPLTIAIDRAIEVIEEKREQDKKKVIKVFPEDKDLQVLNGRWGPYLKFQKENFRIPKKTDPESLTYEDCLKLIEEGRKKKSSKSK